MPTPNAVSVPIPPRRSSPPEPIGRRPIRAAAALLGLLALLLPAACGRGAAEPDWLRERIVSFDADAFGRFLDRAARLEGTPLARHAEALRSRTSDCAELWGRAVALDPSQPDAWLDAIRCADANAAVGPDRAIVEAVRARRGDADGLVLWPLGDDGRIELRIDVDDAGGLTLAGLARPPSEPGALALLVPGADAPEPAVVRPGSTLAHLHARPADGLSLAQLMPAGGQADRLFALKGRLLEGALLTGTWELAFVAPTSRGQLPLAVIALHHRLPGAIERALDQALDQLETTWPVRRTPRRFASARHGSLEGGCFLDLPLLPEFAPCWLVTPEALLVGYRGEAIEAALAAPPVAAALPAAAAPTVLTTSTAAAEPEAAAAHRVDPGAPGALVDVRLDRFARFDARRLGPERTTGPGDLFARLTIRLHAQSSEGLLSRGAEGIAIDARLEARP